MTQPKRITPPAERRSRPFWIAALALLVVNGPSGAQTTNCTMWGNQMSCNTMQPPPQTDWVALNRNLQAALAARRQQKAAAEAQVAQQRYQATMNAAAAEAARREAEREAAQQRLFADRWFATVKQIADSLQVFGEVAARMDARITPTALDLYKVNPQASAAEMREALQPHLLYLNGWFNAFLRGAVAVHQPALDSLKLTPPEVQVFLAAVRPASQYAFMTAPDQTPAQFRTTHLDPLLQRARVYFDSLRTVSADSARRAAAPTTAPRRVAPRRPSSRP